MQEDALKWLTLRDRLEAGRKVFHALPRLWRWPYRTNQKGSEIQRLWDEYEMQFAAGAEESIDRWLRGASLHDIAAEVLELVRIRFDPAIEFVTRHLWLTGNPESPVWDTFLPFPELTVDEAARHFLTLWWHTHGAVIFFDGHYDDWAANP